MSTATRIESDKRELVSTLPIFRDRISPRAEKCKRSLHYFIKHFWDEIVEDPFLDNWHIEKLCHELEIMFWRVANRMPKKEDIIINIPPGTTKSKVVTVFFSVWSWLNAPWMNFITGSYSGGLSLEHADLSRDIMDCPKFKLYFPELRIRQGHDSKSKYQVDYSPRKREWTGAPWKHGGKRYATSVGGTITGVHAHIILIDDPINPKQADATSGLNLKTANDWHDKTLSTRKADKKVTVTVLIMQRLHQNDMTGHLLKKENKKFKHINLPGKIGVNPKAKVLPKEWERHYKKGYLDLDRLNQKSLDEMRADLGNYGYAGQVDQHPVPAGGGMFKVDKLVILNNPPNVINAVQKVWYWDKAGTKDAGAYSVGVLMWEMRKGRFPQRFVIVKVVRGQWSSGEREERIRKEALASEPGTEIVVEQEPGSGGKESAEGTISNLAGLKVYADRPTGDKVNRADPFSVQVEWGNVGVVNGPWINPYIDEVENFPLSTYKDQVDASSGAFNRMFRAGRVGVWG